MSDSSIAIRADALGKRYMLGERESYRALRDTLASALTAPAHLFRRRRNEEQDERILWALRDVSFEIPHGSVVGVIGRNGAGKSTLLKILSRITEPTEGRVEVRGRVGSLLEVGTGFHPELTGRENVFLNGAILGMTKAEITRKFDEIVEFSGLERFIDTPVKRYSSGMYVRLAFAVAAHLEPEILLVDEVLAVGDAEFQRKCLGKIGEVSRGGRTVMFVSHNMGAIRELCPHALWLERGRVERFGDSGEVMDAYLLGGGASALTGELSFPDYDTMDAQLTRVRLLDRGGAVRETFEASEPPTLELSVRIRREVPGLYAYVAFLRSDGTVVWEGDSFDSGENPLDRLPPGDHVVRIPVPERLLNHGTYTIEMSFGGNLVRTHESIHRPGALLSFQIDDLTSRRGSGRRGFIGAKMDWRLEEAAP